MEKTISPEERIRRAEEIYYKRKLDNNSIRMSSSQLREGREKKQLLLYKKLIIQVLICVLIYLIFSLIKDTNYVFSENVINKTKEFLNTDINFETISEKVSQFFQANQDKLNFLNNWIKEDEENEKNKENSNDQVNEQINVENTLTGAGGATSNEVAVVASSKDDSSKKTQMEIDAKYIKKNFSMQIPLKGTITSRYGEREETKIITANHQGIDIAVNEGTTIVSAMEGKVSLVSKEGEYGTHVKIVNKDITTIYAHCSKILVKEGQNIKKGQKIALSGNTGRTTGPHLHFEIRRENRTIDPDLILKF